MDDSLDRIRGCLAGLAVGDAMGRPTELLFNYKRIEKRYGRVTTLVGRSPGAVTDDTRLLTDV
jgi:ADP-ribosylglycohydrolase